MPSREIKGLDLELYRKQIRLEDKDYTDFHSANGMMFGSLISSGFDWGRDEWDSYTIKDEFIGPIRERVNEKIERRYFFRDIGVTPAAKFRMMLVSRINDAMAELGPVYNVIASGIDISVASEDKFKERNTFSEYPQAVVDPTDNIYLTSANEKANQRTQYLGTLQVFRNAREFIEPDAKLLEAINRCFSNYYSFNF